VENPPPGRIRYFPAPVLVGIGGGTTTSPGARGGARRPYAHCFAWPADSTPHPYPACKPCRAADYLIARLRVAPAWLKRWNTQCNSVGRPSKSVSAQENQPGIGQRHPDGAASKGLENADISNM